MIQIAMLVLVLAPLVSVGESASRTGRSTLQEDVPEAIMVRDIVTLSEGSFVMDVDLNEIWIQQGAKLESVTTASREALRYDYQGWVSYRSKPQQEVFVSVTLLSRINGRWLLVPSARVALRLPDRSRKWLHDRIAFIFGKSIRQIVEDTPLLLSGEEILSETKKFPKEHDTLPAVVLSSHQFRRRLMLDSDIFYILSSREYNAAGDQTFLVETAYHKELDPGLFQLPKDVRVYGMDDVKGFKEILVAHFVGAKLFQRRVVSSDNLPRVVEVSQQEAAELLALPVEDREELCLKLIGSAAPIDEWKVEQKYDDIIDFPDGWEEESNLEVLDGSGPPVAELRYIYDK